MSDRFDKTMIGVLPQRSEDLDASEGAEGAATEADAAPQSDAGDEAAHVAEREPEATPRSEESSAKAAVSVAEHIKQRRKEAGLKTQRLNLDELDWDFGGDDEEQEAEPPAESVDEARAKRSARTTSPVARPPMADDTPSEEPEERADDEVTPGAAGGGGTMLLGGSALDRIRAAADQLDADRAASTGSEREDESAASPSAPPVAEDSAPSDGAATGTMMLGADGVADAVAAAAHADDEAKRSVSAQAGAGLAGARTEMPGARKGQTKKQRKKAERIPTADPPVAETTEDFPRGGGPPSTATFNALEPSDSTTPHPKGGATSLGPRAEPTRVLDRDPEGAVADSSKTMTWLIAGAVLLLVAAIAAALFLGGGS